MLKATSRTLKFSALAAMLLAAGSVLTACSNFVDYTHNGSIKLTQEYANRDFFVDGIAEVTVQTYIDGDTTHFKNVYGNQYDSIKIRYYGIDTPESTGAIQEYGKQASNFTHEHLLAAATNGTIVISSPFKEYKPPEADSTGSRYLGLVWINETVKHAPKDQLFLLNLYIVQEGLSWAKNLSNIPEYVDVFQKAQDQAEKNKLKLWSGEPDPLFNYGGFETVSLLEIKKEILLFIDDQNHVNKFNGANVRFTGVVSGFCNNTLYVQEFYPEDPDIPEGPGEWAGINIFTGMTAISTRYTTIGTYIEVVGTAQDSENFGFQITNTQGHWPVSTTNDETDCSVILTAEENIGVHSLKTFEYTNAEMNSVIEAKSLGNLYCRTQITTELVCNNFYINNAGDEITLRFENSNFSAYLPFQYNGNPADSGDIWNTEEEFLGKTFSLSGVFAYHKTTSGKINYQIVPCSSSDMVCLTPTKGTVSSNPYTVRDALDLAAENITATVITYYVRGIISSVSNLSSTRPNLVISDGGSSILANGISIPSTIPAESIVVGTTVLVRGKLLSASGGSLTASSIVAAFPHGTLLEDSLSVGEASNLALTLASGASTSIIYFIEGTVTAVTSAYDTTSKRITFTIADGDQTLVINGAKMGLDKEGVIIDYNQVVVGASIIAKGRLFNDGGSASTYSNGTQVVAINA